MQLVSHVCYLQDTFLVNSFRAKSNIPLLQYCLYRNEGVEGSSTTTATAIISTSITALGTLTALTLWFI